MNPTNPVKAKFADLALGTKFTYVGPQSTLPRRVFVKIYPNLVAEWDPKHLIDNWVGQNIFSATEGEKWRTLEVWVDLNQ